MTEFAPDTFVRAKREESTWSSASDGATWSTIGPSLFTGTTHQSEQIEDGVWRHTFTWPTSNLPKFTASGDLSSPYAQHIFFSEPAISASYHSPNGGTVPLGTIDPETFEHLVNQIALHYAGELTFTISRKTAHMLKMLTSRVARQSRETKRARKRERRAIWAIQRRRRRGLA